ncbi:MAG: endo alpha-1,4 polygalactosaminidase [Pseudomonadota bacterium]
MALNRPAASTSVTRLATIGAGVMLAAIVTIQAMAQPVSVPVQSRWQPAPDAKFDLQFATPMQLQRQVDFLVLDLADALPNEVDTLVGNGTAAVCYFNGGSVNTQDDDFDLVEPLVVGRSLTTDPQERWLDIRRLDDVAGLVRGRLDRCLDKGFQAALVGNLENFLFRSGFPVGQRQQIAFNKFIADEAHARGLAIGMWNSRSQIAPLSSDYDFIVVSGCFTDGWCNETQPFIDNGKPAFLVEFAEGDRSDVEFCQANQTFGTMGIIKRRILDGWLRLCPAPRNN